MIIYAVRKAAVKETAPASNSDGLCLFEYSDDQMLNANIIAKHTAAAVFTYTAENTNGDTALAECPLALTWTSRFRTHRITMVKK